MLISTVELKALQRYINKPIHEITNEDIAMARKKLRDSRKSDCIVDNFQVDYIIKLEPRTGFEMEGR